MAEKKIGGKTYRVKSVNALEALAFKAKAAKVIGSGLGGLKDALSGDAKSDSTAIAAISCALKDVSPEQFLDLFGELFKWVEVQGDSGAYHGHVTIDSFDSQELTQIYEIAFFVLKSVYGGFFSEAAALINRQKQTGN